MNRPSTERILTSLASLESWHSQLSNDTKIIINRPILMHFVAMFWFLVIFTPNADFSPFFIPKNASKMLIFLVEKNRPKMSKNQNAAAKCINIARLMIILVSLESWECQLSNDAKLVKIRPVEGRFMARFWFFYIPHIYNIFHLAFTMSFDQDPHFNRFGHIFRFMHFQVSLYF